MSPEEQGLTACTVLGVGLWTKQTGIPASMELANPAAWLGPISLERRTQRRVYGLGRNSSHRSRSRGEVPSVGMALSVCLMVPFRCCRLIEIVHLTPLVSAKWAFIFWYNLTFHVDFLHRIFSQMGKCCSHGQVLVCKPDAQTLGQWTHQESSVTPIEWPWSNSLFILNIPFHSSVNALQDHLDLELQRDGGAVVGEPGSWEIEAQSRERPQI